MSLITNQKSQCWVLLKDAKGESFPALISGGKCQSREAYTQQVSPEKRSNQGNINENTCVSVS